MRLNPKTYARSLVGTPSRSSCTVTALTEWRQACRVAEAARKSYAGRQWFITARPALGRRGRPVVLVILRWTPEVLSSIFPVRWDYIPVVLRLPAGPDIDMREVVRPAGAGPQPEGDGPSVADTSAAISAVVIQFPLHGRGR